MAKRCPGCGNEVPADAEVCPFCPMSFRDEEATPSGGKRRSHSSLGLFALLGLGLALGVGAWQGLDWLIKVANAPEESARSVSQTAAVPAAEIPSSAGEESAAPQSSPGLAPSLIQITPVKEPKPAAARAAAPNEGDEQVGAVVMEPAVPIEEPPAAEWRLRGTVYDLASLAPLPRCRLIFSDAQSGARYETMTDGHGRYRIIVAPLEGRGYNVRIEREGYAAAFLDDGNDFEKKDAQERLELAKALARSLKPSRPLKPEGAKPLVTDFYLAAEL